MVSLHDAFCNEKINNMTLSNNFTGVQIIIKNDKGNRIRSTKFHDGIELWWYEVALTSAIKCSTTLLTIRYLSPTMCSRILQGDRLLKAASDGKVADMKACLRKGIDVEFGDEVLKICYISDQLDNGYHPIIHLMPPTCLHPVIHRYLRC